MSWNTAPIAGVPYSRAPGATDWVAPGRPSLTWTEEPGGGDEWPDATNTGVPVGTTLSTYSGSLTFNTANQVITGQTINGNPLVRASNVTFQSCKINGTIYTDLENNPWSVNLYDCEIDVGTGGAARSDGCVQGRNVVIRRCNMYGGRVGAQTSGNFDIRDSYVHDQFYPLGSGWHGECILSNGGSGFHLEHNRFSYTSPGDANGGGSGLTCFFGDFAAITNLTIHNNFMHAGQFGYGISAGYFSGKPYPNPSNVVITDNVFEKGASGKNGYWGAVLGFLAGNGNVYTGNTWLEDGTPVPLGGI